MGVVVLCSAWLASGVATAHHASEHTPPLAYAVPAPGSYTLHRIMPAPDGPVLDVDGRVQRLARFTRDKITLLGFIYTTCADPEGCPLAYRVFDRLRERIQAEPAFAGRVRFVTLSFDPARDTPAVMAQYAGSRLKNVGGLEWYFLTTRSARDLMPLVEGFGQDVRYAINKSNGRTVRELSHVLKVFLIDRVGYIREIYSSAFLHPDSVMSDIETLQMELADDRRALTTKK
jgi:protein SCO1